MSIAILSCRRSTPDRVPQLSPGCPAFMASSQLDFVRGANRNDYYLYSNSYTAFNKNIPAGISGCRKKRLNNGTFFWQPLYMINQIIGAGFLSNPYTLSKQPNTRINFGLISHFPALIGATFIINYQFRRRKMLNFLFLPLFKNMLWNTKGWYKWL